MAERFKVGDTVELGAKVIHVLPVGEVVRLELDHFVYDDAPQVIPTSSRGGKAPKLEPIQGKIVTVSRLSIEPLGDDLKKGMTVGVAGTVEKVEGDKLTVRVPTDDPVLVHGDAANAELLRP